ncbi:MAG TPA: type II toxin-antitoxin system Phd/YefM family antitoxin [bacterium]|nr:type II toxin-antitoxin system Phd/YefM family antitoxin [bacterium]
MNRLAANEVRRDFAEALNQVAYKGDRIVIHRRGKDVAVLVPIEDLDLLKRAAEEQDLREFDEGLKSAETEGTVSLKAIKKRLRME